MDLNIDARTNTELGLLRSYIELRETVDSLGGAAQSVELYNAFIQFAGLTVGRANSMFDFMQNGYVPASMIENDTSDHRTNLFAYTFSFGNGVSATLSLEDPTTTDGLNPFSSNPWNLTGIAGTEYTSGDLTGLPISGAYAMGPYSAVKMPDVVANLNITQAWGRAQIMAALHQNYSAEISAWNTTSDLHTPTGVNSDKLGYAVGAGVEVNLPMLGATDKIFLQGIYAKGAVQYALAANSYPALRFLYTWPTPARLVNFDIDGNGNIAQSTAWSVYGGFHHDFSKTIGLNLGASYASYEDATVASFDFKQTVLAGSLDWKPVTGLTISPIVEYRYIDYNTAVLRNGSQWAGILRVQRNF